MKKQYYKKVVTWKKKPKHGSVIFGVFLCGIAIFMLSELTNQEVDMRDYTLSKIRENRCIRNERGILTNNTELCRFLHSQLGACGDYPVSNKGRVILSIGFTFMLLFGTFLIAKYKGEEKNIVYEKNI